MTFHEKEHSCAAAAAADAVVAIAVLVAVVCSCILVLYLTGPAERALVRTAWALRPVDSHSFESELRALAVDDEAAAGAVDAGHVPCKELDSDSESDSRLSSCSDGYVTGSSSRILRDSGEKGSHFVGGSAATRLR